MIQFPSHKGDIIATRATESFNQYLGGFVGVNDGGDVSFCTFYGELTADSSATIGGFVANNGGHIARCSSIGAAAVTNDEKSEVAVIGGFSGNNSGIIEKSFARMILRGDGAGQIAMGGFTATNDTITALNSSGKISNCFTNSALYGRSDYLKIGGFIVDCMGDSGKLNNSYAVSHIDYELLTESGEIKVGQFAADGGRGKEMIGLTEKRITHCYYSSQLNPALPAIYSDRKGGLMGKTAEEMRSQAFVDLLNENSGEADDIWFVFNASDFPELRSHVT